MTLQPSAGVPDGSGPSKEENCSFGMAGEGDAEEQPEEESPTDDETVEPAPCHLKKQRQDLKPGKKLVPRPVVPKNAEEPASGSSMCRTCCLVDSVQMRAQDMQKMRSLLQEKVDANQALRAQTVDLCFWLGRAD